MSAQLPESAVPLQGKPTVRPKFVYIPAVGGSLKVMLGLVFALVAMLTATGVYLVAIRVFEASTGQTYTNAMTLWTYLAHIGGGVLATIPFVVFGAWHWITASNRPNRVAVRLGIVLFLVGLATCFSGIVLIQLEGFPQLPTGTIPRWVIWALHVITPVAAVWIYIGHRKAGPKLKWRWGVGFLGGLGVSVGAMLMVHAADPRRWGSEGPREGLTYFFPSESRTGNGMFIPASTLMMDAYCLECHRDVYNSWFHSAHHFSSFNNPPYLASVRETRKVALERDGDVKAARWCAGCHDPVPFFSGAFDDPKYDDVNHVTAHAGITCTVCHAITHVNSTVGNGAYTIEEPLHYPFAKSDAPAFQWINQQLVKARPDFHKKTFLKPLHKSADFCSVCHKVSLPLALNHYQEFTRGQNHHDSHHLSGVSGHGSRAFYYPELAKPECSNCHMPLMASGDFGAKDRDGTGIPKVHDHFFPAANTGLPALLKLEPKYQQFAELFDKSIKRNSDFLTGTDPEGKDKKIRVDLFALKKGGTIDAKPEILRPNLPKLQPGQTYLFEVVIRTLGVGHHFSQGTVDSNEIWVDFQARFTDKNVPFARNGSMEGDNVGEVDRHAHFINVHLLDRSGNRINRRNPQDIFTPLYDHQIPPGAGNVVHYQVTIPKEATGPVELAVRVRYRKFDDEYLKFVYQGKVPVLPIVDMATDRVTLPLEGSQIKVPEQASPIQPAWQRWNDYGIGCLLEGGANAKKGELRQAEEAFKYLTAMPEQTPKAHGWTNLARVYFADGRLDLATAALNKARDAEAPWWTLAWFNGLVHVENATEKVHFERAIEDFEKILDPDLQPAERKFDFTRDYVVRAKLGQTLYQRAQLESEGSLEQRVWLTRAAKQFYQVLQEESEDLETHYGLAQAMSRLASETWQPALAKDLSGESVFALLAQARLSDDAIANLRSFISHMQSIPAKPNDPYLPHARAIWLAVSKKWSLETDPGRIQAMENLLADAHRLAHKLYKPDDLARSFTTTKYRAKNPAANAAAEAIILYPTNRPFGKAF